jgi:hypothetical protein
VVDGVEEEHGDDKRQEESTTVMGWSGLPTSQQGLLGIPPWASDVRRCEGACHKRGSKGAGSLPATTKGRTGRHPAGRKPLPAWIRGGGRRRSSPNY